jgi:enoyl-CoA hydratase
MARQMSFTGNYVDADAALRCELMTMLVPHGALLDQAMALAGAVASTERSIVDAIRTLYDADDAYAAALRRERDGYLRWRADFDGRSVAGRVGAVIARGREQTRG